MGDEQDHSSESKTKRTAASDSSSGFGLSMIEQLQMSPASERTNVATSLSDCEYDATMDGADSGSRTPRPRSEPCVESFTPESPKSVIHSPPLDIFETSHPASDYRNGHDYSMAGISFGKDVAWSGHPSTANKFRQMPRDSQRDTPFPQLPELPQFHPLPFVPGLPPHPKSYSYLNPLPPPPKGYKSSSSPQTRDVRASRSASCSTACSNPHCGETICQLQSQMEALERQNKLLEAALHAVLWTAGSLNGCPCSTSAGYTGSIQIQGLPKFPSTAEELTHMDVPDIKIKERRPSSTSIGSRGSTISALEMYKETRL
jgi:hypothetical protein